jgi:signal transduction histidine kinase
MKLRIWIPSLAALLCACALFFVRAYDEAKRNAVDAVLRQERLDARQASLGIEEFFDKWKRDLSALARTEGVANLDDRGRALLESFYEANRDRINAITVTDARGVIVFTCPDASSIHRDISFQKHVKEIMRRHDPVVSDVFRAIQGYDAVALHVPVLRDGAYGGSLAITINFQVLAKRFFDGIRVGKTGYAWVLSRDGTELYCPVPGHTGRSIFATSGAFPSVVALAKEMVAGREGTAAYTYDAIADRRTPAMTKYAVYMPIRLGGTFWSVAVATPKDEVLAPLTAFRNQLLIVTVLIFLCGAIASALALKATSIVREEARRKRDEAERRLLQEALQQATKMESIGRLAGGIAHDFNNVLTSIVGNASLAMAELGEHHEAAPFLHELDRAAQSAASLTRQLLAFARKEAIAPVPVDLNALIADLRRMLARVIGEDVALRTELAGELGAVKLDPGQLEQVLLNLAVNARDAMPSGGTLEIATANEELDARACARHGLAATGWYVVLAVRDTGCGMTDDVKRRIFEPFFTTKPSGQGTGLGLSTVYGAIAQAGGAIEVRSAPGEGAQFRILLPRCDEPAVDTAALRQRQAPLPRVGTETILLAEDDRVVRELEHRALARLGYHVLVASDGAEACAIADGHDGPIDLLLTDVVMPEMNGRELADRLLARRARLRVLFMSGYSENIVLREGTGDARESFIAKPHTPSEIAAKIREILDA